MSPIMEMTNVTFEEISKERISESFGNNDLIGTLVFLLVSIVLFFTMPYKMLSRQKKYRLHSMTWGEPKLWTMINIMVGTQAAVNLGL